jgi:hypothetical protein
VGTFPLLERYAVFFGDVAAQGFELVADVFASFHGSS